MTDDELIYAAWVLIANAGEGVWESQTQDWQRAAASWRDEFHRRLDEKRRMLGEST